MTKPKFNETQIAAACNMLHAYTVRQGTGGTDTVQRQAVLAIFAVMIGQLRAIPDGFKEFAEKVELYHDNENLTVGDVVDMPVDAPSGETVLVPKGDYDRWESILSGLSVDHANRTLALDEASAIALRDPEDATPFPEVGLYITYASAAAMVEQTLKDAANPDTIIGKQVREAIAVEAPAQQEGSTEPNGDGSGKIDFDGMTLEALRKFAADNNVDLEGTSKKVDIIARLREFNF